ncbi:MAG: response regulator [Symploca sp. SIO3E6]|nr:response regulator [Caldora sp. SIO3E6]
MDNQKPNQEPMTPSQAGQQILIVDDNPTNLKFLSTTLNHAGWEIAIATNGDMAIQQVKNNPPSLILLDIILPESDGLATYQKLKASPDSQDIPIIVTLLSETVAQVKSLSLEVVDYITKPFQLEELLVKVRVHLQVHYLTKNLEQKNQQLCATREQLQAAQKQMIAQEKLATIGALTAGVIHEVKNALNFVNNYAQYSVELSDELLEEVEQQSQKLETKAVDYMKENLNVLRENVVVINQQGQRADSIMQNMLMQARTDEHQFHVTDLNSLLDQAMRLVYQSRRAQDNCFNIKINTDYDDSIEPLELISAELSRAFINIIDNACYALLEKQKYYQAQKEHNISEFMPKLWLTTKNLGKIVEIRICDNGIGIAPEAQEKIFQPFYTTKPTGEGTGLGLPLTYEIIVEQHGGMLKLESELGVYTEFIIILFAVN